MAGLEITGGRTGMTAQSRWDESDLWQVGYFSIVGTTGDGYLSEVLMESYHYVGCAIRCLGCFQRPKDYDL